MCIFAQKCKNRDLNVIGAISFIKYVHMVEGVAVKSSSNRVNAIEKHRKKWEFLQALMVWSVFLNVYMSMCTVSLHWWCIFFFLLCVYFMPLVVSPEIKNVKAIGLFFKMWLDHNILLVGSVWTRRVVCTCFGTVWPFGCWCAIKLWYHSLTPEIKKNEKKKHSLSICQRHFLRKL